MLVKLQIADSALAPSALVIERVQLAARLIDRVLLLLSGGNCKSAPRLKHAVVADHMTRCNSLSCLSSWIFFSSTASPFSFRMSPKLEVSAFDSSAVLGFLANGLDVDAKLPKPEDPKAEGFFAAASSAFGDEEPLSSALPLAAAAPNGDELAAAAPKGDALLPEAAAKGDAFDEKAPKVA